MRIECENCGTANDTTATGVCLTCGGTGCVYPNNFDPPEECDCKKDWQLDAALSCSAQSTGSAAAPIVRNDPVHEAIARKLSGISNVPPLEQGKMIQRAAKAGAEALRKQND